MANEDPGNVPLRARQPLARIATRSPRCSTRFAAAVLGPLGVAVIALAASAGLASTVHAQTERWYSPERVHRGGPLYARHCAICHGAAGEGAANWQERDAEGRLPPPPLDGTGHAWHHPIAVLARQIKYGTPAGLGTMPGFDDHLDDQQLADVIAWFQERWPDPIYDAWLDIERRARAQAE